MVYTIGAMPSVKLSSQRQITIPKMFLEMIGAKAHDQLSIRLEDKQLILELVKEDWVERLAGSWKDKIPQEKRNIPLKKAIGEAQKIAVQHIAQEGLESGRD